MYFILLKKVLEIKLCYMKIMKRVSRHSMRTRDLKVVTVIGEIATTTVLGVLTLTGLTRYPQASCPTYSAQ